MNIISSYPQKTSSSSGFTPYTINSWINPSSFLKSRVPTTFYHDILSKDIPRKDRRTYNLLQGEPEVIIPKRNYLLENAKKYDYVLTWDEAVLRSCPNAVKYIFGGCWVHPPDRTKTDINIKSFAVSTLVGSKAEGDGHRFRLKLFSEQRNITNIPKYFYRSSKGVILPDIDNNPIYTSPSKFDLFKNVQFSIVIENSKELNYFTEKLIDCLITKTVPIYWGCPNIGEYFYTEGMICLKSTTMEELLEELSKLTPETYQQMLPMVEQNYQKALQYVSVEENINRALRSISNY